MLLLRLHCVSAGVRRTVELHPEPCCLGSSSDTIEADQLQIFVTGWSIFGMHLRL
jgi:hypothetical protein